MTTTRREFLAAAAAVPISPILLNVQNKDGSRAPVLGEGTFTYEAIHDWGQLPPRIKWGNTHESRDKFIPGQFICPHGACFDEDGNIFVVEWGEVGRRHEAAPGVTRTARRALPVLLHSCIPAVVHWNIVQW